MKESNVRVIKTILYVISGILVIIMLIMIVSAIKEYNQGLNGYSYSHNDLEDLEYNIEHGEYSWMLRDLKYYRDTLLNDDAGEYEEVRSVAEYYQFSVISRAYSYTGDKEKADLYAKKAADEVSGMGKYAEYREDIDKTISVIGN